MKVVPAPYRITTNEAVVVQVELCCGDHHHPNLDIQAPVPEERHEGKLPKYAISEAAYAIWANLR